MSLGSEVEEQISAYLDGDYEIQQTKKIPGPTDVPFGKVAKKLRAATFAIDLRDSTGMLEVHQKQTAGKIHKAFLYATARSVLHYNGFIRNFRGDGLLAMWPAESDGCSKAVRAAMTTKWLLSVKLKGQFDKYRELDYGIGVDVGDMFVVRAGTAKDANTNDLVFISPAVNFAVAVAEQASGPSHVEICGEVYDELPEEDIYGETDGRLVNIWTPGTVEWRGARHSTKCTTWYQPHD